MFFEIVLTLMLNGVPVQRTAPPPFNQEYRTMTLCNQSMFEFMRRNKGRVKYKSVSCAPTRKA